MKKESEIGVYEVKSAEPGAAAWMAGSNFRAARLKTMRARRSRVPLIIGLVLLAAGAGVCIYLLLA